MEKIMVPPVLSITQPYLRAKTKATLNLAKNATMATPAGPKVFFSFWPKPGRGGDGGDGGKPSCGFSS